MDLSIWWKQQDDKCIRLPSGLRWLHIVAQSFRKIDEPFSSAFVIDEFDDECMDDNDDMLFLLMFVNPGAITFSIALDDCRLFSNGYNAVDDVDDVENKTSADVSSSVNGSDRVRWWKQLKWFDFVICVWIIPPPLGVDEEAVVAAAAAAAAVVNAWFDAIIDVDFILQRCAKCSDDFSSLDDMHDMDDVNEAVVVIGNENALWCDTVNWSFDARTEKLFAASTVSWNWERKKNGKKVEEKKHYVKQKRKKKIKMNIRQNENG